MMAHCRFPGCKKTLVGREKLICKSCKDKLMSKGIEGGKRIFGMGLGLLALIKIVGGGVDKFGKRSDDEEPL
jgi:hypothetical protein